MKHIGCTKHFATMASEFHRSVDTPLNAVHRCLHSCASTTDGHDDQVVRKAVEQMALASIDSNTTGCTSCGVKGMMHSALAYWP